MGLSSNVETVAPYLLTMKTAKRLVTKKPNTKCAYCKKRFWAKTKKSKSGLRFCCRSHKDLAQRIGGFEEIQSNQAYGKGKSAHRTIAIRAFGRKCQRCSFSKSAAAIEVHHKDRNRSNNKLSNLEVLCANCHAMEHEKDYHHHRK